MKSEGKERSPSHHMWGSERELWRFETLQWIFLECLSAILLEYDGWDEGLPRFPQTFTEGLLTVGLCQMMEKQDEQDTISISQMLTTNGSIDSH